MGALNMLMEVSNPTVEGALTDAATVVTKVIQTIGSQPILLCAFGMGVIIPAGTKAVRKLIKSVR